MIRLSKAREVSTPKQEVVLSMRLTLAAWELLAERCKATGVRPCTLARDLVVEGLQRGEAKRR